MKTNEKKWIIILAVILVIAIIVFLVLRIGKGKNDNQKSGTSGAGNPEQYYEELEDGTKLNISTKLNQTKTVDGLEIGKIQLTNKDNQTVLLAEVENKSGKVTEETLIDVTIIDKDGKELGTIGGMIAPLKEGEKTQLNISAMQDYTDAYDFKFTIKK